MLEKVMLPVPPLTEIDSFSKIIKQSDKSKFEAKQAIQTLDSLYLNIEKKCFS
jgi:predicted ribonuclease YlaK